MNGVKTAVVILCVCSVCYSLILRLINNDTYKVVLKTVFGMALIVVIITMFSNLNFEFDYSASEIDVGAEDIGAFSSQMTLRLAEQDLELKARELLKSHNIIFESVEITMDKADDGSIVINKAEIVFDADSISNWGIATEILKGEFNIDFSAREV